MNLTEAIKQRYSVRAYKSESVPEEKLNKVLEAARMAPSAHNAQEWKFVVVRDEQKRQALFEAAGQGFLREAPVIIAGVALAPEDIMRGGAHTYAVDLAIAIDHMTLQAVEEGLGTCWVGSFSQETVKSALNIPEQYKVVALLSLGYPADSRPSQKSRKSLEEIVCYEDFTE